MPDPDLTVVLPTHNPNAGRLRRTLAGLGAQTLPPERWDLVVVDNASSPPVDLADFRPAAPARSRIAREPALGLSSARRRGLLETRSGAIVLVDDDNVLAPDYLERVLGHFAEQPRVGALGGRSLPEFEIQPEPWAREFLPLLAVRDPGEVTKVSNGLRPPGARQNAYPIEAAPIGAGMALRREAAHGWLDGNSGTEFSDRRGSDLSSSGDNDIVLSVMKHGWEVAYFPDLVLTHLIPAGRLQPEYLARLNRGIQKSWMEVLSRHGANPWEPIPGWTAAPRKFKAWFTNRAWAGPAERIRWSGACGHFEGRVRKGAAR